MKLLNFNLIVLFALLFITATAANAQVCGRYKTTVLVQDELGKPLENAAIQLLPITKDETFGKKFVRDETDLSKFSMEFTEGQSIKKFHKLIVSADGFKTAENEIKFLSCRGPHLTIKLPKSELSESPVWEFENSIMIETEDTNGEMLKGVKIIVKKNGKIVETQDSENYGIGFSINNGEYVFRLEKEGYQTKEIKVDMTKIADVELTVELKSKK